MTESTARIRWEDPDSPGDHPFKGSIGPLDDMFRIHPPEEPGDEWLLTTCLPGMAEKEGYSYPDDLKIEAERWLEEFISSLGAIFPGGHPDGNAIEAYCATGTGDGRHLLQYAVRLPDGTTKAYGDQSWVASGLGARDHDEGSSTVVRDIWVSYGPWRTHEITPATTGGE